MQTWLRVCSVLTVVATVALLALGALVTSFHVGMADPIWPTEPWRLALIDWSEPSAGFLIEHTHRLAGFTVGAMMAVLSLGIWWSESNRALRWSGLTALIGLLGAFGYLHGVLIRQTKVMEPGSPLTLPPNVAGILVVALAAIFGIAVLTALKRSGGWGLRLLAIALLIGVMIQGLFGGLRVYLNVLFGHEFAVVHGSFAQVVFGLAIVVMCGCIGRAAKSCPLAWLTVCTIFTQIVFGVFLRQLASPIGARLHLLVAIAASMLIVALSRATWKSKENRAIAGIAIALLLLQLLLGVESWMVRFANGLQTDQIQPITRLEALMRTAHALVGYVLFATTILLSFGVRNRVTIVQQQARMLEGVA